ncbi:MAG: NCS2 family permease [Ruminococcaceae bacterium]|nr:NCS2 family permease [Oscillospiraceae bacterium]
MAFVNFFWYNYIKLTKKTEWRIFVEKLFKIKERGSNIRTEVIGGIVTFFAMAYIIFVNPSYLSQAGMNFTAVMLATCLSAAIGTILTAFLANVPFAQAPGMGLNAFFTYTICFGMGYTWQQGLAIVFISGILFLVLTLSPLRSKLIESVPAFLKSAISAGIGLFITFIGLLNADIVKLFGDTVVDGVVVGTDYSDLGNILNGTPLLALIGLLITALLLVWKVKGAIFIGIIITTIIGIPMGQTTFAWESISLSTLGETAFKMDFAGLLSVEGGLLSLITAVVSFFIVDCFDTAGTLIGTATNCGLLDEKGRLPGGDRAMIADAIGTCAGAALGTSTVTTFVESSTGISEGARTGLASIVTGVLFLLACFLAPVAGIIPTAATAPALIIVGVFMLAGAARINWSDLEEAIPAFLTIVLMAFSYSISDGIGIGFIFYSIIKICRGKAKEVPVLVYIISLLFIGLYVLSYVL